MERSSKHGARLDDALAAETDAIVRSGREPRVEEHRELEPAGDDQPVPGSIRGGRRTEADPYPEVSADELDLRSEIARHLRPSVFPADRDTLERVALDESAPEPVLSLLRSLPRGTEYENVQAIWQELGHPGELHRF